MVTGTDLTASDVLEALPHAAAVVDATGRIVAVNDVWRRFAADNDADLDAVLVGADYLGVCVDEAEAIGHGIRSVLAGTQAEFSMEYPCHAPDEDRWFRVTATPIDDGALVTHTDITGEYHRVNRWLLGTNIVVIELRPDLSVSFVNAAWRALAGPDEWTACLAPSDAAALLADLGRLVTDRRPVVRDVRAGGSLFRMSAHVETGHNGAIAAVIVVGNDVTAETAAVAHSAVAHERRRLATELHDVVLQRLYATGLELQRHAEFGQAGADVLSDAVVRLDRCISDIRAISEPTRPVVTGELLDAVDLVIDDATAALGFDPETWIDIDPRRIDATLAGNLLAVLSESLSNVARHAGATSCEVRLGIRHEQLSLTVVDDGRGMPDTPSRSSGTRNIADRALELGGRALWTSAPFGGTVLTWQVPLDGTSSPGPFGDAGP